MTKEVMDILSQERLKELFHYEPLTGQFTRLVRTSNNVNVGDIAGCKRRDGYKTVSVDGRLYLLHQLAWLYVFGFIPKAIDHIDRDRSNNSLANLRECTAQQNNWNQNTKSTNKSGVKGVHWDSKRQKWMATIRVDGRTKALGRFEHISEAETAYRSAVSQFRSSFLGA